MSLSFEGQNILIFGGSNGVGLHLAHRLVETGAKVIIVCKSSKNIKKVESLLKKNSYKIVINDCYKFNNTKLHKVCKSFFNSRFDHLISFLGTGKVNFEMPKKLNEWKDVFNKNFFVNVNLGNEFSDYIIKKNFSSSIILTAAIAGIERVRAPMTYSIAKTSLIVYANHLSEHMLKKKIRVFSVSPGNIFFKGGRWEEIQKGNKKNIDKFIKNNVGFKRFGTPEEIATVYLNLMHQSNSFMTGNNLIVDGLQSKKIL
jgi:3-oxoacyl-[acyl-carrier protein] reductase